MGALLKVERPFVALAVNSLSAVDTFSTSTHACSTRRVVLDDRRFIGADMLAAARQGLHEPSREEADEHRCASDDTRCYVRTSARVATRVVGRVRGGMSDVEMLELVAGEVGSTIERTARRFFGPMDDLARGWDVH
jgi:hypothetical protein